MQDNQWPFKKHLSVFLTHTCKASVPTLSLPWPVPDLHAGLLSPRHAGPAFLGLTRAPYTSYSHWSYVLLVKLRFVSGIEPRNEPGISCPPGIPVLSGDGINEQDNL